MKEQVEPTNQGRKTMNQGHRGAIKSTTTASNHQTRRIRTKIRINRTSTG